MSWPNLSFIVVAVAALAASLALYTSTGLLHVYAYFIMIGACAPLLIQARAANIAQWSLFLLVWWNISLFIWISPTMLTVLALILVECLCYLKNLKDPSVLTTLLNIIPHIWTTF